MLLLFWTVWFFGVAEAIFSSFSSNFRCEIVCNSSALIDCVNQNEIVCRERSRAAEWTRRVMNSSEHWTRVFSSLEGELSQIFRGGLVPLSDVAGWVKVLLGRTGGGRGLQTCGSHTSVARGHVWELTTREVSPLRAPLCLSIALHKSTRSPLPLHCSLIPFEAMPPPLFHTSRWANGPWSQKEQYRSISPSMRPKSLEPTCKSGGQTSLGQDLCLLFLQECSLLPLLLYFIRGGRLIRSGALSCFWCVCLHPVYLSACLGEPTESLNSNWLGRNFEGRSSTSSR